MRVVRSVFGGVVVALVTSLAGGLAAQTPTMYGTPQTAYDAPYGSTLTLNLPNGGTAVGTDTVYIIEAALRGENSEFATPSGWSDYCSLQADAMDHEQIFYIVYPSGATPPSSLILTTNGSTWMGALAVAYQGINASTPFDAPNGWCSSNSAVGTADYNGPNSNPSSLASVPVSNSVGNDLVLFSYFANGDVGTSQPAVSEGTLEAQVTRQQLDAYGYLGWVDMPMPGSGSSGANTLSWVPGGGWGVGADGVLTMALAPAGSSPAQPPPLRPSTQAVNFGEQSVSAPPNPSPASISGGGHEMVSPENGSLNFSFQLPVPPGRQLKPDLAIAYSSSEARTVTSFGNEVVDYITEKDLVSSDGWSYPVPSLAISTYDASPDGVEKCTVSTGYSMRTSGGDRIPFNLSVTGRSLGQPPLGNYDDPCDNWYPEATQATSAGWSAKTTALVDRSWKEFPVFITDPDGTTYQFATHDDNRTLGALAGAVTDRNGNMITYAYSPTGLQIVDTLGRTISFSSIGQATDTITIPGMANSYQVHWAAETASATNNAVGVGSNPCVNKNVTMGPGTAVTSIATPEGTYVFSYDPVYGTVNKITYPNGGYVRYVWGMDPQSLADRLSIYQNQRFVSCDARIDNPVITDRYVSSDGATETEHQSFTYTTTWDASNPTLWDSKTTTVITTDVPDGTHYTTVYTYSPGQVFPALNSTSYVATQIPLATSITSNDFSGGIMESVNQQWETGYPFKLTQKSASLNGIATSLTNLSYDANAQVTEKDEWGYPPAGGAAALLRKTCTIYATFTVIPGIVDRPAVTTVYDGSGGVGCGGSPGGNWVSETNNGYDETAAQTTNLVVQHQTGYGYVAGNLTSTHGFVAPGTSLTTVYTNDDTGQRLTSTDAANHTTTYSYTDSFASGIPPGNTNAYLTQATDGLGNVTKYTWNYAGGTMASTTDANNQITDFGFDAWDRLDDVRYPDGGETTYGYTSSTIETRRKIDANGDWSDALQTFDGLERPTVVAHETSAGVWSRVDTCYNPLGLKGFVSYPNSSTSNGGAPSCAAAGDTFTFDALGRVLTTTHAGGGLITYAYTGNATEVADEGNGGNNVTHVSQSDGLGRLVSVCEVTSGVSGPGGTGSPCSDAIGATGLETDYGYSTLGDLTSVTQGAEIRSFQYDALSRLTSAANPETGAWRYAYDSDSNCAAPNFAGDLVSRTDARGVRTCYQYDADHHLLAKTYSDATPAVTFTYGGTAELGIGNLIGTAGRLSSESTADHTGTVFSYDPMGRTALEYQLTPNAWSAPATFNFSSGFDLAGDLTSFSFSKGDTAATTFDLAGEPLSLSTGALGNLVTGVSYNANGQEVAAMLGNGLNEDRGYDARLRPTSIALIVGQTQTGGTPGTGTISVEGSEQVYEPGNIWDTGAVYGQVGTAHGQGTYGSQSTAQTLASALAAGLSGSLVTAVANGADVEITANSSGSNTNYPLSASSQSDNPTDFPYPSFTANASGPTLTGGTDGHWSGGTTVYSFSVASYAPDSAVLATTDTVNGNFTYTMDSLNRIATASCTAAPCSGDSATYNIDRYGNRWSETGTLPGAAPPALSFTGNNNRVDGWSYDANGNLLNDQVHLYQYDAENRLTQVDSGATASYIYNAEGARVHENVGGTVEEFLNGSGPQSLTIVDGSQNLFEADYSFGGRPLATANSGGLSFAATDTLGTVRARLNASGAIVESDTSWPYGEFRNYANAISRIHFTGKLDDTESGLDSFGARYYAASLGSFMTPDWSATPEAVPYANLENPQSLNLYSYVLNNPVTATDPDGHWCFLGFGTSCTPGQKQPVKEGGTTTLPPGTLGDDFFITSTLDGLKTLGDAVTTGVTTLGGGIGAALAFSQPLNANEDQTLKRLRADGQPASEQTARDMAKQIERDLGADARRDFHDAKEKGSRDRTQGELKQDAERIYREHGKNPPKWMQLGGGQ